MISSSSTALADLPESLLVLSDVHLGSDIADGGRNLVRRSSSIDRDLVQLIDHYRAHPRTGSRWRLVIAGDFIDFIGMTVRPDEHAALHTPLNDEERSHGLGSAADHARLKLRRVAERHAPVFVALAAFVAAGHGLTLVHGNHDIELYWDDVQTDFREVLQRHARAAEPALDAETFAARIEFNPWFFYRDGVAYIEHGHQYDPFCATAHVMAPLSPTDPRRVARGFCDTLLRYVVRQTRGMSEHGHEHVGMLHYVAFAARLGLAGTARLGLQFVLAVTELFRLRRAHWSEAGARLREEHERRVAKLAEVTRDGHARLRALLSLQVPPITSTVRGILKSLLLDRIGVALASVLVLALVAAFSVHLGSFALAAAGAVSVGVGWALLDRWFTAQRNVDPTQLMVDRATQLARIFPAAFVVMGHTHTPASLPAGDATYVNVGAWAEEEHEPEPGVGTEGAPGAGLDPEAATAFGYRAPRTHLVIHVGAAGAEAQFFSWHESGPKLWSSS